MADDTRFAELDPARARRLVRLLRSAGLQAWMDDDDRIVHVAETDQTAASAVLADRFDELSRPPPAAAEDRLESDGAPDPPLVLERFRSAGALIAVVLVPLLAVALSQVRLARGVVIALVVVGIAALALIRQR